MSQYWGLFLCCLYITPHGVHFACLFCESTTQPPQQQQQLVNEIWSEITKTAVPSSQLESHDSAELVTQKATLSVFPETNVLQIIAILILETEIFPKFFV